MTFQQFTKMPNIIDEYWGDDVKGRQRKFVVKLNDGDTIEFFVPYSYKINRFFDCDFKDGGIGIFKISIHNEKENRNTLHIVPCENIDYINVIVIDKEEDVNDSNLIAW